MVCYVLPQVSTRVCRLNSLQRAYKANSLPIVRGDSMLSNHMSNSISLPIIPMKVALSKAFLFSLIHFIIKALTIWGSSPLYLPNMLNNKFGFSVLHHLPLKVREVSICHLSCSSLVANLARDIPLPGDM